MIGFSIFDYILLFCTLGISTLVGIYFAIRDCLRQRKSKQTKNDDEAGEFLMGGRRMPLIPTALSLLVSFVSGISMLSYPSEIYFMGTGYCWAIVGDACGVILSGIFILPTIYPLPSMSIYAYLEERFESRFLRLYASTLFQLTTLVYTSVVLYAPSIALSGVTGIDLWVLLVTIGAVCTIYTSIGGLKAVVWTDALQAVVMYAGLLAMVIKGTMAVGGFNAVFETARRHGRSAGFFNFDPNPLQYTTVWTSFFGGTFFGLGIFGANQIALQRYCSLPSLKQARAVIFSNAPLLLILVCMVFYIGLTMFAYSIKCLWRDENFNSTSVDKDQLVIYYMLDLLGEMYGLPGLFVACVFSATLSTASSSINSLSAVVFEDFLRPWANRKRFSQVQIGLITKVTAALYGVSAVCLAFACVPLGGTLRAVTSACGALAGPLVGLILLGILFPCANRFGAIVGAFTATCIDFWIFIGGQVYNVQYTPLSSVIDCRNETKTINRFADLSNFTIDRSKLYSPDLHGIEQIYALSFTMHACVGAGSTLIVGLLTSILTGCNDIASRRPELVFWTRGNVASVSEVLIHDFEITDEHSLRGRVPSLPDLRKRTKKRSNNYAGVSKV